MTRHVAPHRAAMEALDEAQSARRRRDERGARAAMRRAFVLETQAAELVPEELEPTRSILFRSAASLAAELGDTIEARRLAIAGLRGNTPADLKAELFELLDGLVPRRVPASEATIVQQLRIHQVAPGGRALTIPMLAELQALWVRTIDDFTVGMNDPVFLDAGTGSFVIRYEISGDHADQSRLRSALAELRDVSEILLESRLRQGAPEAREEHLQRIHSVLELLTALTEANVVLEVTTAAGRAEAESFELHPPSREDLEGWQRMASSRIPSEDVPQADDLERVLRFVEIVSSGQYPTPETLSVVSRQVNYYRRATEILGYVRDRVLTPSGRLLVRLTGSDRWMDVLEHVTTSNVGSAWIDWSGETNFVDIDPASARAFLAETAIGLSDATMRRRALTLSTWHAKLVEMTSP
ncbi:hypothetical protein [Paraliomyxa miuraensis]|uniref:hypothetical protein n=1 Tax=Paraliomyxa miuraensis TaxID=376150 RepID=UPI002251560D|nr:hypothetical protein [Paraliomyxa miuraensis]MCX4241125.1 hypothetical protein [Paraliomyxa miuraensis]